jgi:NTE family protein
VSAARRKKVSLALQGGGAHGAFTWGVLDLLLEDGRLEIEAISGASAGAMNAVCLASGYMNDGADGARKALSGFWRAVSSEGAMKGGERTLFERWMSAWSLPAFTANPFITFLERYGTPYQFNPLNINPLERFLDRTIDFEAVRSSGHIRLFVSATDVWSGKIRIFEGRELTARHLMASACLPRLFQAVEIDGRPFWDGGYMGNPPLFPLFYGISADDILLVQINPVEDRRTPRSVEEIESRMNEITFNATLLREMRAISFVNDLIEEGRLSAKDYKPVRMHRVALQDATDRLAADSKLNTEWDFFLKLHKAGRKAAERWLWRHYEDLGRRATVDLRAEFS